jgi:hypothetical protein
MTHTITCSRCDGTFAILTFSLGMSDITQYRCAQCPNTLEVHLYSEFYPPPEVFPAFRCECGGPFHQSANHRCPLCKTEISMEQIKSDINWWGSADGIPGVRIVSAKVFDERGRNGITLA